MAQSLCFFLFEHRLCTPSCNGQTGSSFADVDTGSSLDTISAYLPFFSKLSCFLFPIVKLGASEKVLCFGPSNGLCLYIFGDGHWKVKKSNT